MTELDSDARALIRAARHGDDPSTRERSKALARFRSSLTAPGEQSRLEIRGGVNAGAPGARAFRISGPWLAAAAILSGSLAALADWTDVRQSLERVFGAQPAQTSNGAFPAEPAPLTSSRQRSKPSALPQPGKLDMTELGAAGAQPVQPEQPASAAFVNGPLDGHATPKHDSTTLGPLRSDGVARARAAASTAHLDTRRPTLAEMEQLDQTPTLLPELGPELALIVAARDAFDRRQYSEARRLLALHAASDARGDLAQERHTIAALIDCFESGDTRAAERYVQRWPRSVFASRIVRDCRLEPNSVSSPTRADTHSGKRHDDVP